MVSTMAIFLAPGIMMLFLIIAVAGTCDAGNKAAGNVMVITDSVIQGAELYLFLSFDF